MRNDEFGEGLRGKFRRAGTALKMVKKCRQSVEGFAAGGRGDTAEAGGEWAMDDGGEVGLEPREGFALFVALCAKGFWVLGDDGRRRGMNGGVSKMFFEMLGAREVESTRFTMVPGSGERPDVRCFAVGTLVC